MPIFRVKTVKNANFLRYIWKNLHRPKKVYTGAKWQIWGMFTTNVEYLQTKNTQQGNL